MSAPAVYKLRYGDGFEWLLPTEDSAFDALRFTATPVAPTWAPVRMKALSVAEDGTPLTPSDFPACSGGDMLILSNSAKDKLGDALALHGEFLPLSCDAGSYWAFNVTRTIAALDEGASQVLRSSASGAILRIRHHVFDPRALKGAVIFKLPQMVRGLIYVTRSFVDMVEAAHLRGLEFDQVWAAAADEL